MTVVALGGGCGSRRAQCSEREPPPRRAQSAPADAGWSGDRFALRRIEATAAQKRENLRGDGT